MLAAECFNGDFDYLLMYCKVIVGRSVQTTNWKGGGTKGDKGGKKTAVLG